MTQEWCLFGSSREKLVELEQTNWKYKELEREPPSNDANENDLKKFNEAQTMDNPNSTIIFRTRKKSQSENVFHRS